MMLHEALQKFIDSRNDQLVLVDKAGGWKIYHKDDCPNYAIYNFIDSEVVFSVLKDIMTHDLLLKMTSHLS